MTGIRIHRKAGKSVTGTVIFVFCLILSIFCVFPVHAEGPIVSAGATWKYLDNGSDQGTAWRETDFDDSLWSYGHAELGYGDEDEETVVGYGGDPANKYITTYFRHSFDVTDSSIFTDLILRLRLLRDDGAIAYLNGHEILRSNMPEEEEITYTTLASSGIWGDDESIFQEAYVDPTLLRDGDNVLAVEIHQVNPGSSDISFDLQLRVIFTVNSTTDVGDAVPGDGVCETSTPGECTLRAAIQEANASAGTDEIIFDPSVTPGTFMLTIEGIGEDAAATGDLDITDDLVITGAGANKIVIDCGGFDRGFDVIGPFTVEIDGLTVQNGNTENSSGGAIRNDQFATLTIANTSIAGNSAGSGGGIDNKGTMTITNSSIAGNSVVGGGAGIANKGTMTITSSTVSGNTTQSFVSGNCGGGIFQESPNEQTATLAIINSSISGNAAAFGGGIFNENAVTTITNSTISGNTVEYDFGSGAGGGISNVLGLLNITNSTIAGNLGESCGGIRNSSGESTVELLNTILANNIASVNPDCSGSITSLDNNLIGDTTGCGLALLPSDLTGDPGLGEFTNDGRPGKGHFPLESTSAAIDAGNSSVCIDELAFDQLGFPRVDGDGDETITCDIGAIEFQRSNIYRFVVMADSRDGSGFPFPTDGTGVNEFMFPKVLDSINQTVHPQPTFILFGGDLVTGREDEETMIAQFQEWKELIAQYHYPLANVYPVFGGHERKTTGSEYPWSAFQKVFDPIDEGLIHPSHGEYFQPEERGNSVYCFEHQNATFFVLNNDCSPDPSYPSQCFYEHEIDPYQESWLRNKLEENGKPLKFFFYHEPAYGTGAHGWWPPLCMDLEPLRRDSYITLLAEHNATMVFSGHEHQYTRRLIDASLTDPPYDSSFGCFYEVKTGTCGAPIRSFFDNRGLTNILAGPVYEYHYAVVDVHNADVSVNVYAVDENGDTWHIDFFRHPPPPPLPKDNWTVLHVDSEELVGEDGAAVNAFDGDPNTIWHTQWYGGSPGHPHEIQIDLSAVYTISGFRYLPRQDGNANGRIAQYEFYVSVNEPTAPEDWGDPVAQGVFANTATEKEVQLSEAVSGRYVRLVALSEVNDNPWTSVAELNILQGEP